MEFLEKAWKDKKRKLLQEIQKERNSDISPATRANATNTGFHIINTGTKKKEKTQNLCYSHGKKGYFSRNSIEVKNNAQN